MTGQQGNGRAARVHPLEVRADGLPMLPGGNEQQLSVLRRLLEQLGGGRELTAELAWPTEQDRTTVQDAVRRLGRVGLVRREGDQVVPTAAALTWCAGGDDALLVETFHRHVAFIGELMAAVAEAGEPLGLDALLALGHSQFGFSWKTVAPVRQRINWLRVTGMVSYFDERVRLTERGRELTPRLVLPSPRVAAAPEQGGPIPSSDVLALLAELTVTGGHTRSTGASLYVLGDQDNGGRLRALRTLTEGALPTVSRRAFVNLCARVVQRPVPKKSAATVLDTVTTLGLLEQVAEDAWRPTPVALAWLASGDPFDLAGIIHAHVAYFGELLSHLADTTARTTAELSQLSAAYLDGQALRVAPVSARLQLLSACGLAAKRTSTTYQATPAGRAFLEHFPLAPAITGPDETDTKKTPSEEGSTAATPATRIAQELESAAHDSAHPERLEHVVIAAFAALGLDGKHIGGSGHADGALQLGIGAHRRTVAVEAKTAATGPVPPERVIFEGLAEHRERLDAAITLLVGPQFHDRVHKSASRDQAVAVLHTDFLAELVRDHESTPLGADQLDALINPRLDAREREEAITEGRQEQLRRIKVERAVVAALLEEAEHSAEGWLTLRDLERDLRKAGLPDSKTLISQSLDLLGHPRIAAVERRQGEFRIVADRKAIGSRMRALGSGW
ncbi:hypothetical protein ACWDCB_40030 [Streptomyces sp. NPDC001178]